MSYLICQDCGRYYQIDEGKTSFNYEKCDCGGKLEYSPVLKEDPVQKIQHPPTPPSGKIKWKAVLIGLLFLFLSLVISVICLFGNNIPSSPSDIPSDFLTYFSILTVILTIISGSISAFLSGCIRFWDGALNGGMVGVVLGFILGFVGGITVFFSGIIIFGSLSLLGGIIGVLARKNL